MAFLIVAAACVAGLVIGGIAGDGGTAMLGFFGGLAIGIVLARQRTLSVRVAALEAGIAAGKTVRTAAPIAAAPTRSPAPATTVAPAPSRTATSPALDAGLAQGITPQPPPLPSMPARPAASTPTRPPAAAPASTAGEGPVEKASGAIKRWFTEGNVPVKVGVLVLIAGVAALLKYASDEGWLRLPIEARLAGVAIAAIAALMLGWRERVRRRGFGLGMQALAIGVLLMTVFAAFRFYGLLPAGAAFALMIVLVAGIGMLAVLQDAMALAVLGILAGFAAPILISTGSGNHVVLFSYYALLNVAIFAIAWHKAWRPLNVLGFASTFVIGTAWGALRYEHALFPSTEPFLLTFFAIYLAIPILYARKRAPMRRDVVDGTLVFANPLIAFALQAVLLDGERMPLAYCALALAAIYALLAWALIRRDGLRVLAESFAVLAVGFATLAVPLALSARSTACTFALEGAALVWLGLRQQRRLPRFSGLLLQLVAAASFAASIIFGAGHDDAMIFANGGFVSAILIAAAAFVSAWLHVRFGVGSSFALVLYLWGLAWWCGAGLREIDRFVPSRLQPQALLAWVAVSAALAALAYRKVPRAAPAWTAAIALASGVALMLGFADARIQPFSGWALAASAVYAAAGFASLLALRPASMPPLATAHLGWIWTWVAAFAIALLLACRDAGLASGWRGAAALLPLVVVWLSILRRPQWIAPPLGERFREYRGAAQGSLALVAILAFCGLLLHPGDTSPIAFVPIVNPIELVQIGVIVAAALWLADADTGRDLAERRAPLLVAAGFAFVTAATLRAVHHLGGVAWDSAILSSSLAQMALTVVWSVLGVVSWVLGSRRGSRPLWLAGAVLMGIVLAKLLLIDRTHLGNLFGIASFIAYGLLCTVIGYFAPAPPRAGARKQGDSA